ncbi:hypothetical protein SLA2020_266140 [Shorea laevis]
MPGSSAAGVCTSPSYYLSVDRGAKNVSAWGSPLAHKRELDDVVEGFWGFQCCKRQRLKGAMGARGAESGLFVCGLKCGGRGGKHTGKPERRAAE